MTGIKKRSPTNKEFKRNFQGLASSKVKKGHLSDQQERKSDDKQSAKGILVRIEIDKIDDDGWEVEVGTGKNKKKYMCSDSRGGLLIPDSTISKNKKYYITKAKTEVEIDIDKKSKIYRITKINSDKQIPLSTFADKLYLSPNSNTKTNQNIKTLLTMSKTNVVLQADEVIVKDNDNKSVNIIESNEKQQNDIQTLQEQNLSLDERIKELEKIIKNKDD